MAAPGHVVCLAVKWFWADGKSGKSAFDALRRAPLRGLQIFLLPRDPSGTNRTATPFNAQQGFWQKDSIVPFYPHFRRPGIQTGMLRLLLDPLRADGRAERFLGFSHQQGIALALMFLAAVGATVIHRHYRPCLSALLRSGSSRSR